MLITPEFLIDKLPTFKNKKVKIIRDQNVNDIIDNLLMYHDTYSDQYKNIAPYFLGFYEEDTLKNIFKFLKKNVEYYQEPTENQTLQTPASILTNKKNDCKNYALFIGGILQALNENGYNIPFSYRFASYNAFSKQYGHVFVVAYPGTKNEIWIDPVLDFFNDRSREPYYYIDKQTKKMKNNFNKVGNVPSPGMTTQFAPVFIYDSLNPQAKPEILSAPTPIQPLIQAAQTTVQEQPVISVMPSQPITTPILMLNNLEHNLPINNIVPIDPTPTNTQVPEQKNKWLYIGGGLLVLLLILKK